MAENDPDDFIVMLAEVRPHHCVRGLRRWLEMHDFDVRAAFRDGVPASALLATGDALAVTMVETARVNRGR